MSPSGVGSKKRALRLNSLSALHNLRATLAAYPSADAELEVVDVLRHPEIGLRENVLITPTMIKLAPPPVRKVIGNLKDTAALAALLGLVDADHD
jgi:circadian clock protein KaiB